MVVTPIGKPHSSGLSGGQKAGISIGVILGVGLIGGLVWWFIRRRRKARKEALIHYEVICLIIFNIDFLGFLRLIKLFKF